MSVDHRQNPFEPVLPNQNGDNKRWSRLYGAAMALALANAARRHDGPVLALVPDTPSAMRLYDELDFFSNHGADFDVVLFPDWETLPYDDFSPHHDIVSERLSTLYRLPDFHRGVLIVPVATAMTRIAPQSYLLANTFMLAVGDALNLDDIRRRLERAGYRYVSQVMEHGEFSVRGSLLDLFPMGTARPYRIDLFDDEIDSIRTFVPDSQRSLDKVEQLSLIPAREFPTDEAGIATFRARWRFRFEGDPNKSPLYRDVSQGLTPSGIEYYLPLFFEQTSTLLDFVPDTALSVVWADAHPAAESFWTDIGARHENHRHNTERPLLEPNEIFVTVSDLFTQLNRLARIHVGDFDGNGGRGEVTYATRVPMSLPIDGRASEPLKLVEQFIADFDGRLLFIAESDGRREVLLETLASRSLKPRPVAGWQEFLQQEQALCITVAALDQGAVIESPKIAIVTEAQLFGDRAMQRRRRKTTNRDAEAVIRDLAELHQGSPVVHEHHGVGRYQGLCTLTVGGMENEFLALSYADDDKLYVPVASLHLVSRYAGADADHAPLHRLGSGQWQKARKKAAERACDVAAELLEIHARRAARTGHPFAFTAIDYQTFSQTFPFEETPDQEKAIVQVMEDMMSEKPMDRLVCGDVGFGKTEVAMRAAFIAVQDGRQVAVLVPTTLLAQQHHQTFQDRFADWPVRVELLSRFRSQGQQNQTLSDLASGRVDVVIGTHKLLNEDVRFKRLGLVIIDEEHRFGVRQKERLKSLRAEVDILTLTATPIPRTLNLALSGIRDLTLIGTPPEKRLSIKTFIREWNDVLLREACVREIRRGGQVFFVHNRVEDIEKIADKVEQLVPEAEVRVAHGQMRELALEQVMLDFYHRRFNILVCTTIIETGIDVPNANTMIINRADRFGLAQLHQLRGRVGRSHHRAYAYLMVPPRNVISADAVKRLEAIESLEDLGIGFSLATHDLEIRGAGEILGEEQSGQIHEVGYTMYTELLERAVNALKVGRSPELDRPLDHGAEIDLSTPALIPEHYLPDIHNRLIMYKRIANADSSARLKDLQVEMIDRFGLLPEATRCLFRVTELKLKATPIGVRKIELGATGGRITFARDAKIEPAALIRLIQEHPRSFKLDGPERLRVIRELPDVESRFDTLVDLLGLLQGREAA